MAKKSAARKAARVSAELHDDDFLNWQTWAEAVGYEANDNRDDNGAPIPAVTAFLEERRHWDAGNTSAMQWHVAVHSDEDNG